MSAFKELLFIDLSVIVTDCQLPWVVNLTPKMMPYPYPFFVTVSHNVDHKHYKVYVHRPDHDAIQAFLPGCNCGIDQEVLPSIILKSQLFHPIETSGGEN